MFAYSAPKFALSLALLAIVGVSAQSAEAQSSAVSRCVDEVYNACGRSDLFRSVLATRAQDCKNLDSSTGATRTQVYQLINGDVLTVRVKGQGSCRFKVAQIHEGDAVSGGDRIVETKVEGNKAFFRGSRGGGYLARMEGNGVQFYELLSGRGKPFRFATGAGVKDIRGTGNSILYVVTNANGVAQGAPREIKPSDVQRYINEDKLRARDFPDVSVDNLWALLDSLNAPPPPPETLVDASTAATWISKDGPVIENGAELTPPPPYGYEYDIKNVYTPSSSYGYTSASAGDCQGTVSVERLASNRVKVNFTVSRCSKIDWERVDGQDLDVPARLNTAGGPPFTGSFIVTGNAYRTSNNARFVLHSNSGATGVKVYIHF